MISESFKNESRVLIINFIIQHTIFQRKGSQKCRIIVYQNCGIIIKKALLDLQN